MEKIFSSKIIYAAILGLAIVGLSFYLSRPSKTSVNNLSATGTTITSTQAIILNELLTRDSDSDGLADWEEALWGTDQNNPDTYGHGLGDRAEVQKKRDLAKAPGDSGLATPQTETGKFGQELFVSLLAINETGALNKGVTDSLSSSIARNLNKESQSYAYVRSDIKTVATSETTLSAYRKGILQIIDRHRNDPVGDETKLIAQSMQTGDRDKLSEVKKNAVLYKNTARDYLTVAVPDKLLDIHLALVNSYEGAGAALDKIESVFDDPIVGIVELKRYRDSTDKIIFAFQDLANYFSRLDMITTSTHN